MASKIWSLLLRAVITGPVNLLRSERGEEEESIPPLHFYPRLVWSQKTPWKVPLSRVHLPGETVLAALPSDVLLITLHSWLQFYILAVPGFNLHRNLLPSGSYPAAGLSRPPPFQREAAADNVSRGRL